MKKIEIYMVTLICTSNKNKSREFKSFFSGNFEVYCLDDVSRLNLYPYSSPEEDSNSFIVNGIAKLLATLSYIYKNKNAWDLKFNKIVVDDSGLLVPDLGYIPGVHSAIFSGLPRSDDRNNKLLISKINESHLGKKYGESDKRLKAFYSCFLFTMNIPTDLEKIKFIHEIDFSKSSQLVNSDHIHDKFLPLIEKSLLEKTDLDKIQGYFFERVKMMNLSHKFPDNLFIDLHYGYCCGEVSTKEVIPQNGIYFGYDSIFYSNANTSMPFSMFTLDEKNKTSHRAIAMKKLKETI